MKIQSFLSITLLLFISCNQSQPSENLTAARTAVWSTTQLTTWALSKDSLIKKQDSVIKKLDSVINSMPYVDDVFHMDAITHKMVFNSRVYMDSIFARYGHFDTSHQR